MTSQHATQSECMKEEEEIEKRRMIKKREKEKKKGLQWSTTT